MSIDDYFKRIREIALTCVRNTKSVHDFLQSQQDFAELQKTRSELLDDKDIESVIGLLETGLFLNAHPLDRLAIFRVCLDVESQIAHLNIRERCVAYQDSPLINALPSLSKYVVDDLIKATAISKTPINTDVVEVEGGFVRLDPDLSPAIAAWVVGTYSADKVRLRFDPRWGSATKISSSLREHVIRVPNPTWWSFLGLHRGTTDGGRFELTPDMSSGHMRQMAYWEYHVKGVRWLEVFVKRENQGRLSMMVEEISVRDEANGFIVGRCIHLDTESPEGTAFDKAVLKHIDLAINVYEGERIRARKDQKFADTGTVVDASCRTHLIRVDGACFPILFDFAKDFFLSKVLTDEWITNHFKH